MEIQSIGLIAVSILAFGAFSGRLEKSAVTPAMAFTFFGLAAGPALLGLLDLPPEKDVLRGLAEVTLVLVLFTDASRIHFPSLRKCFHLPLRLLGLGLPLTIILGAGAARSIFPELGLWAAVGLAAILAPTDAALSQAVVVSPQVPARIRQALNVESGLNDGIALPGVLIALSLASAAQEAGHFGHWTFFALKQLTIGPLAGVVVGYGGGKLVLWGARTGIMSPVFEKLAVLGLSILAYAAAELVGASGLIAAFVAGLSVGNAAREACDVLYEFGEAEGQLLALLTFLLFGATLAWPALKKADGAAILYAVLSLSVIRMAPVALSLIGRGLRPATVLFLAWFGPRGLASLLFGLLVLQDFHLSSEDRILSVVMLTVLMSVVAHGLTAHPAAAWYARHVERMRLTHDRELAELEEVSELPVRLPYKSQAHRRRRKSEAEA